MDRKGDGKGSRVARELAKTALPKRDPDKDCNALIKDRTAYCSKPAGWGTDHAGFGRCKRHGGSTELAAKGAAMERALALADVYGTPERVDPHQALLQELERTSGHVSWLFIKVNEVGSGDGGTDNLVGPVGEAGEDIKTGTTHHPNVEPSVWLRLYQEERKHLVSVAQACIKAGIEERRVQIAEAQGMMIARAIQGILKALGVADHPKAGEVVREHLMELSASQPQHGPGEGLPALEAVNA